MIKTPPKYVLCVRNDDCQDLEVRKLYQALPDKRAAHGGANPWGGGNGAAWGILIISRTSGGKTAGATSDPLIL
jgi:hypothetical protein